MSTTMNASVMARLKSETAEQHRSAERKPLQQQMLRGVLPREAYGAWLGQMLLVHRALERAIEGARPLAGVLKLVTPEQEHSPRLEEDLRTLGTDPAAVRPNASTARLVADIERLATANPAAAFGLHYVLEGSMNGNKYIAMAMRRGQGLAPGVGDRYLDPYGEAQRGKWAAFREAVDACAWNDRDADAAVEAAKMMFDGIGDVCGELLPE
ncbi:MAG: biliverdin-producing heme oxygenase [Phycisphaerales bacterium]|nr:biliverdin-producing heme oxygenase [Phycisphaerales bacterium]